MQNARGTIVVDVTYMCNATCRYCRWGSSDTPGRMARSLSEVLIPRDTLRMMRAQRVVISGGEPRLHPELDRILGHYSDLVDQVVVISNGYGLDSRAVEKLLDAGATGITVSLDSTDAAVSFLVRRTPPILHKEILRNLADVAKLDCETGINCTVSHITANWITVGDMLDFGANIGVDFVKFQPIFDDGYAGAHSADLLLRAEDVPQLLDIASRREGVERPPTNPPEFWTDVATLAAGRNLPPSKCSLGTADAISVGGGLAICYWVESSYYRSTDVIPRELMSVGKRFEADKMRCKVGYHCFCNQGVGHVWAKT